MSKPYRSTSRFARGAAALAAVLTVMLLFDFVAGLGESKTSGAMEASAARATSEFAMAQPAATGFGNVAH